MPECPRCSLYKGEVALLRAEIAGLRASVLALTRDSADGAAVLEIVGMHEPERLTLTGPFGTAPDVYYRAALTFRDQLSARCLIANADPAAFLRFFSDLAQHRNGWEGVKKIASPDGQFTITCTYEGKMYRPEVSMEVYCALGDPSWDPYWTVQLHLDVDPESLGAMAARARAVFASATPEPPGGLDSP